MRALVAAALALAACNLVAPSDIEDASAGDEGSDRTDEDGPSGEPDGRHDAALLEGAGPLTLVAAKMLLVHDRLCDLDGDGDDDNVVADLGDPAATLFSTAFNVALEGTASNEGRLVFHAPWIEDRSTPEDAHAVFTFFGGRTAESGACPAEGLPGSECFHASFSSLDACGEPIFAFPDAAVEQGGFEVQTDAVLLPLLGGLEGRNVRVSGMLGGGGDSAEMDLCSAFPVRDLGVSVHTDFVSGMSMLEVMLAGGSAFGLAGVPGVQPDVDADQDGLERLTLGDDLRIISCTDGDGTVISGSECWQDPRMEDGFSANFHVSFVGARYAGCQPEWSRLQQTEPGYTPCVDPPEERFCETE